MNVIVCREVQSVERTHAEWQSDSQEPVARSPQECIAAEWHSIAGRQTSESAVETKQTSKFSVTTTSPA